MWWTIGFLLLTAWFASRHLRERSRGVVVPTCPACGAKLDDRPNRCTKCGIPLQIFEVVGAEEALSDLDSGVESHAVVRSDLCVGCGVCVPACPEEGALRMEGKLAMVDLTKCVGHGHCAEACPVSAIVVGAGNAQRVEVPRVGADFQSDVAGIYVVGELGGRGLIKNAINEGCVAARSVAAEEFEPDSTSAQPHLYQVAIVGSGPAGLSAALECKRLGVDYVVLEQGSLADTIRKYPRHKLLLAEPVHIPLYGDLWIADTSKESLLAAWETIVEVTGVEVKTQHRVIAVEGRVGSFLLRSSQGDLRAARVILAMGRRGSPRRLGIEGEDCASVFYDIVEMEAFAGRRVVVVGGGDSALESALGLAEQEGTEVILSYRKASFDRAKERNVAKLDEAESRGALRVWRESQVRAIRSGEIDIEDGGGVHTLPNDDLIVRIGGEAPYPFLERIGVQIVKKDIPLVESQVDA